MAPEAIRGEPTGLPSDIWGVGCTVLEMLTGIMPWIDQFDNRIALMFHVGHTSNHPPISDAIQGQARDFLEVCMRADSKERPTVGTLLEHPWIRKYASSSR